MNGSGGVVGADNIKGDNEGVGEIGRKCIGKVKSRCRNGGGV